MLTINQLKVYLLNIYRLLTLTLINIGHSHYILQYLTMVYIVKIGGNKESQENNTKSNVLYNSVKLALTIDAIEKSLEMMNFHVASIITTRSTTDLATKSVLRLIKSEISSISSFNTILK